MARVERRGGGAHAGRAKHEGNELTETEANEIARHIDVGMQPYRIEGITNERKHVARIAVCQMEKGLRGSSRSVA